MHTRVLQHIPGHTVYWRNSYAQQLQQIRMTCSILTSTRLFNTEEEFFDVQTVSAVQNKMANQIHRVKQTRGHSGHSSLLPVSSEPHPCWSQAARNSWLLNLKKKLFLCNYGTLALLVVNKMSRRRLKEHEAEVLVTSPNACYFH